MDKILKVNGRGVANPDKQPPLDVVTYEQTEQPREKDYLWSRRKSKATEARKPNRKRSNLGFKRHVN